MPMSTLESCIRKINRESVIDGISEEICAAMNNGSTPAQAAAKAIEIVPRGYEPADVCFAALDRITGPIYQRRSIHNAIRAALGGAALGGAA